MQSYSDNTSEITAVDSDAKSGLREDLRESELYFRAVFENAPDAMLIADDDSKFVDANSSACTLFRVSQSGIVGRRIADFVETSQELVIQTLWEAFRARSEQRGEFQLNRGDGTAIRIEYNAKANILPNRHLLILRDVTERNRAEEALRFSHDELARRLEQSTAEFTNANKLLEEHFNRLKQVELALTAIESQFQAAQRIAHLGNWERDVSTNEIYASDELRRIFYGYVPEDPVLTYDQIFNVIHPEDRELFLAVTEKALENKKPFDMDYRVVWPDGSIRMIHVRGEVISDELGNPSKVRGIAQDITERKQAEVDLKKQKEILQKIFDHIPMMISFFDQDGRINLVNREWERIRGWSLNEIQGQNLNVLARTYPDPKEHERVLNFIAAATGEWGDFKTKGRGGQLIDSTWAVVRLSDGTRVAIGKDITDRKRVEEERSQLMRRLITAQEDERRRISRELHDNMGQYLAAFILGLESVISESDLPARAQDNLLYLKELTERFEQEVHRFALELRPTTLDDLGLHAALSNWVEAWTKSHQKVRVDFHSTGFSEHGERLSQEIEGALYRVVQEALTNVLKHAGAQHVSVILERQPDSVRIIVEDDGKGFDLERSMMASVPNMRLGLTGMRERIDLIGGTLKIDSGAGTTIVVSVPLSPTFGSDSSICES